MVLRSLTLQYTNLLTAREQDPDVDGPGLERWFVVGVMYVQACELPSGEIDGMIIRV